MGAQKQNIIVVGNGMVGYKFCEKFLSKKGSENFNLAVFGEETRPAYDRVHLSEYFVDGNADKLSMAPFEWYLEKNITIHLGDPIYKIDREKKTVCSSKGVVMAYDKLIMATGSAAFVPQIKGVEKEGIFVYRTIEDLDMMKDWAKKSKRF